MISIRLTLLTFCVGIVCLARKYELPPKLFEFDWVEAEGSRLCEAGREGLLEIILINEGILRKIAESYNGLSKDPEGAWYTEWKA
jgi:hypothetical protein